MCLRYVWQTFWSIGESDQWEWCTVTASRPGLVVLLRGRGVRSRNLGVSVVQQASSKHVIPISARNGQFCNIYLHKKIHLNMYDQIAITCVWIVMITSLKKIIMCSTVTGIIWVSHLRDSSLKKLIPILYVFCLSSEHKIQMYHVYHIRCALCASFNIYRNISLNKSVYRLHLFINFFFQKFGLVNGQNWCETIKNVLYLNITICAWIFHSMNRSLMSLEQHVDE